MERRSGFLTGVRVIELADELGEYCGKLLAGLGADVVKVEQPGGEATRSYGPFAGDIEDPESSLYFWHYNLGKRGIVLDLETSGDREIFRRLATNADVVIDSRPKGYLDGLHLGYETLRSLNPRLVYARVSAFGDSGPWGDYRGSDLVHLALGGVMMNCGYDPDPTGRYDTPPIAPQMWQSNHIVGEMTVISILGALIYRLSSGEGQLLEANVHEAVSKNTETDLPDWLFLRQEHMRMTCRHSAPIPFGATISLTKDGRYMMPYRTYLKGLSNTWSVGVNILKKYGMEGDLLDAKYEDIDVQYSPDALDQYATLMNKLVNKFLYSADFWREGLNQGLTWAPIRKPEENATDPHWQDRDAFTRIAHPERGESYTYVGAKWYCEEVPWQHGPRAPFLNEHADEIGSEWSTDSPAASAKHAPTIRSSQPPVLSAHGKPFALSDVRVIDLSWMLASAGGGRFLAAMGAEVIKVEHNSRVDGARFGLGTCPPGGRAQRDTATEPIPIPADAGMDRGGYFMEINSGKLGISLNLKSTKGRKILEDLIRDADVVVEGFSPGTFARMGFSYERLRELNPHIVYVQQSGLGDHGRYKTARAFGPTAQGFSGLSEMSGLPEPFPPAGIGYSYLDWFGAYNFANAILAGLYRRFATGEACHIDASQVEAGMYVTGTAVLDRSVNGRSWSRYGNRSPYKPAAPSGAYPVAGDDRWIAISAFSESDWHSLIRELGSPEWAKGSRFSTQAFRIAHHVELDRLIGQATSRFDGRELMARLQAAGVAAGVCQTAQDRYEKDPQLAHLGWVVELDQTEIGRWPVREHPVRMSATPTYIGGRFDRSGPSYGHDTDDVLQRLVGLSPDDVADLRREGVL